MLNICRQTNIARPQSFKIDTAFRPKSEQIFPITLDRASEIDVKDYIKLICMLSLLFSRRDDTGLEQVFEKIEEVVLASQGLEQVSSKIEELVQLAGSDQRTTVSLTVDQAEAVKHAFACIICTSKILLTYLPVYITPAQFNLYQLPICLKHKICTNCMSFTFSP